jgi:CrcB protein
MTYELLAIGLGGAMGALCRYGMTQWANALVGINFPYSTLIINVLGSFAIGIVFILLVERNLLAPVWRSVLMVGFLGAFTTFSTFSLQALGLMEEGRFIGALAYIGGSVVTCILATALGMYLARQIA